MVLTRKNPKRTIGGRTGAGPDSNTLSHMTAEDPGLMPRPFEGPRPGNKTPLGVTEKKEKIK